MKMGLHILSESIHLNCEIPLFPDLKKKCWLLKILPVPMESLRNSESLLPCLFTLRTFKMFLRELV